MAENSSEKGVMPAVGSQLVEGETDTYVAGQNKEVVWTRWQRKRSFVRALEGNYGELYKNLFTQPRVYRSSELKWKGGPTQWFKKQINPQSATVAQSIEVNTSVYSPGIQGGQKHGHMNSAVFFMLKGKGHDVHDGVHIPWEAGDAVIVENSCVHQHFNDLGDDYSMVLIMKAKPLFLFMHMLFQKVIEYPVKIAARGYESFTPPE